MTPTAVRTPRDESDLEALRTLLGSLIASGQSDEALDLVVSLLGQMRSHNDALQVRLRHALRQLYGRRSEKLNADQLELFARLLADAPAAAATPSTDAPADTTAAPSATPPTVTGKPPRSGSNGRGGGHGRSAMPDLPKVETTVPVPDAMRACGTCGDQMRPFDTETRWQVEYEPGRFVVQVSHCEKVSCTRCRDAVVTAPAPPKVIDGGQPGPGLLARLIVDKAEDHLPLERQQRRMAREGWTVPPTTVAGWWEQALDLLPALHEALTQEAMRAWLPQVDATGLDVLDRDHPKGIRLGHVWTVVGDRAVSFVYTPAKSDGLQSLLERRALGPDGLPVGTARSKDAPAVNVVPREGAPVHSDGELIFGSVLTRAGLRVALVHCWMHARRYFERASKAGDLRAAVAMSLIGELYQVEREAKDAGLDAEGLRRLRIEKSAPIVERLRQWALEIRPGVVPSSPLGKALG